MQTLVSLGSKRLIKVGGSYCLPIPSLYIQNMNTVKGTEFNIELLDDKYSKNRIKNKIR